MIASTQITTTNISAFIAVVVFNVLLKFFKATFAFKENSKKDNGNC